MKSISIDLSKYLSENKKKNLYQELLEIKKFDPFPPEFKIIFYHTTDLYSTASSQHGDILNYLIKSLSEIDIPFFFIEIVSSNKNINQEISHVFNLNNLSKKDLPKTKIISNKFTRTIIKKQSFCVLPWIHYYISPQGDFTPCCVSDLSRSLGNIKNSNIDDLIFKNKKLNDLRKQMTNNERPEICSYCWKKEDQNQESMRQRFNKKYNHIISNLIQETESTGEFKNFKLKHVDVRFENTCNLKCRMCSGKFSSQIAVEDAKFFNKDFYLKNYLNNSQKQNILNNIEENINNIETVYFAGGEPLISQSHYEILDLLLKNQKTDISISYNTNFTNVNYKKYNLFEYWKKFKNVNIGASIDLIGDQSDYIRDGTDYNKIEKNFYNLKKECPHVNFTITSILHVFNVENLIELQKHWLLKHKLDIEKIEFTLLVEPEFMSISVLPNVVKQKYISAIKNHIGFLQNFKNSNHLVHEWNTAIQVMLEIDNSHLIQKLLNHTKVLDNIRKKNIEDYYPELYNKMIKALQNV